MQRLVSNNSGLARFGPKWQNRSIDSENDDDDIHSSADIEPAEQSPTITTAHGDRDEDNRILEVRISEDEELMYRAALEGNWLEGERLVQQDERLAFEYVTEMGDRALHVATAMKREEFVKMLVKHISNDKLVLLDGRGHTACCYAAISGEVEIARVLVEKNQKLVTTPDKDNVTPLYKAALRGNKEMLRYLLTSTESEDLTKEKWLDLLFVAIQGRMYDMATKIMGTDPSIATESKGDEGTALHLLAQHKMSNIVLKVPKIFTVEEFIYNLAGCPLNNEDDGDLRQLQGNLWDNMERLGKGSLLELITKPRLLHDATKAGNVELVTMIIRSYPQLIWDTDSHGYDIFHIAVMYRQSEMFHLISEVEPMMGFRSIFQDQEGNNILHLAAKPAALAKRELPLALQMRSELLWFKMVEKTAPPACAAMRNKKGLTPRELFSKEHKRLLEESETWMRNTANSCMLISTILLTVVFAAAFTVPGGYGDHTGEPILAKKHWFKASWCSKYWASSAQWSAS